MPQRTPTGEHACEAVDRSRLLHLKQCRAYVHEGTRQLRTPTSRYFGRIDTNLRTVQRRLTLDSGTPCATSQAQEGFSERLRLTIMASANPLSCLRKVRNSCR